MSIIVETMITVLVITMVVVLVILTAVSTDDDDESTSVDCTSVTKSFQGCLIQRSNVGNTMAEYFTCISYQMRKRGLEACLQLDGMSKFTFMNRLPARITVSKQEYSQLTFPRDVSDYTTCHSYAQWNSPTNVLWGIHPVIRSVVTASLGSDRFDLKLRNKTVVVHFRASDSPFVRHPSLHFLKYSWYRRALEALPLLRGESGFRIIVLNCPSHRSSGEGNALLCKIYRDDLMRFLKSLPSVDHVSWEHGTVEQDVTRMVRARYLVSSGSSMSTLCAMASDGYAVLPVPLSWKKSFRHPTGVRNKVTYLRGGQLDHAQVKSYKHTKRVIKLLSE
jgi:hypothetical protein